MRLPLKNDPQFIQRQLSDALVQQHITRYILTQLTFTWQGLWGSFNRKVIFVNIRIEVMRNLNEGEGDELDGKGGGSSGKSFL
jgi:hypothetical protein